VVELDDMARSTKPDATGDDGDDAPPAKAGETSASIAAAS
jgi:hypothetical protein